MNYYRTARLLRHQAGKIYVVPGYPKMDWLDHFYEIVLPYYATYGARLAVTKEDLITSQKHYQYGISGMKFVGGYRYLL